MWSDLGLRGVPDCAIWDEQASSEPSKSLGHQSPCVGRGMKTLPAPTRITTWIDQQLDEGRGVAGALSPLRQRATPTHWSNMFGTISGASLVVLIATGVFLMFFYSPSPSLTRYDGPYAPLRGVEVSESFASTMYISFEVSGGLLIRQAHHWAALLLPAALLMQIIVTFFTGAFRRPRRPQWILLLVLMILAMASGWSGYALPDDSLSAAGLRIVEGMVLGIPVVGAFIANLLFGGPYPSQIVPRLFVLHLIFPVLLIALMALRVFLAIRTKAPQFAEAGREEDNVVGVPFFPTGLARSFGLGSIVTAVLFLLGALVTITPVWLFGPASPSDANSGSQPDWYMGFLDGALRLVPPGWEVVIGDRTLTLAILAPLAVITLFIGLIVLYPWLEEWLTGDTKHHHLLDRPRNTPVRTGFGAAGLTFYGVLWIAASADLISTHLFVEFEAVIVVLRFLLIIGPFAAFMLTRRIALALQRKDREIVLHGRETGRIVRLPWGEYTEIHQEVSVFERWKLVRFDTQEPLLPEDGPGLEGRLQRTRATVSRFFFEDRVSPVKPSELSSVGHELPQPILEKHNV